MKKLHQKVTLTMACVCLALVATGVVQATFVQQSVSSNPRVCEDCVRVGHLRREYTTPSWWCQILSANSKNNDGWIYECDVYHCVNGKKYFRNNPRLAFGCYVEHVDPGCPETKCLDLGRIGVGTGTQ